MILHFLEASHFKINACLCKLEGHDKPQYSFQQYITSHRDKQVLMLFYFAGYLLICLLAHTPLSILCIDEDKKNTESALMSLLLR